MSFVLIVSLIDVALQAAILAGMVIFLFTERRRVSSFQRHMKEMEARLAELERKTS